MYSALRRACGRATYDYFGSRYERGGEDIPVSELSDVQVREWAEKVITVEIEDVLSTCDGSAA